MSWTDLLLAGIIIAGALYLLYHSLVKKQGHCSGCRADTCPGKHLRDKEG
jgi:hypothetical protein